jgi:hypothetical protein
MPESLCHALRVFEAARSILSAGYRLDIWPHMLHIICNFVFMINFICHILYMYVYVGGRWTESSSFRMMSIKVATEHLC